MEREIPLFGMTGRLNRKRYFLRLTACIFVACLVSALTVATAEEGAPLGVPQTIIFILCTIVGLYFSVCQCVRRLKDTGVSPWWYLCVLIPFANMLLNLYMLFWKGTEGPNRYGPDPLSPAPDSDFARGRHAPFGLSH